MHVTDRTPEAPHRARPPRLVRAAALLLALVCAACESVQDPYTPFPVPNFGDFVTKVQPIVARRCAAAGCHGTVGRSLTLYAVDFLRAQPAFSDTPLDEKYLTDAELAWNFDALRMRLRSETSADRSALLLKCLDPKQGGIRHADGVVVFADRNAADYKTLRNWIAGGLK